MLDSSLISHSYNTHAFILCFSFTLCLCDRVCVTGVASSIQDHISGSVLEVAVGPGDNITLYCDCKLSTGVYVVWYRNCSHENQPSLVLRTRYDVYLDPNTKDFLNPFPRFHLLLNKSSQSYDLLITSLVDSDEGLYYCRTELINFEDKAKNTPEYVYEYGKVITRILLGK